MRIIYIMVSYKGGANSKSKAALAKRAAAEKAEADRKAAEEKAKAEANKPAAAEAKPTEGEVVGDDPTVYIQSITGKIPTVEFDENEIIEWGINDEKAIDETQKIIKSAKTLNEKLDSLLTKFHGAKLTNKSIKSNIF